MTLLMCLGRTMRVAESSPSAAAARFDFLSLHCLLPLLVELVFVGWAALELEVALPLALPDPEPEDPEPEPEPPASLATAGPGMIYGTSGENTSLSKIPGSVSLYAPGMVTSSFGEGVAVPEPPTRSWAQAG